MDFIKSKTYKDNPSKRFIGVEVEIAYADTTKDLDLRKVIAKWGGELDYDGSISGGKIYADRQSVAHEVKTAPANGDRFIKQMEELGEVFEAGKCTTNSSCGLHVHIDARDLKGNDLEKLLILWSKVEAPMYSIIAPRRKTNSYCKPWKFKSEVSDIYEKIGNINDEYGALCDYPSCSRNNRIISNSKKTKKSYKSGEVLKKLRNEDISPDRYMSLNLLALSDHGTVENRMHHGTTNVKNIIPWAIMNACIVDYAKKHSMKYIVNLSGGFDLLMQIAPNNDIKAWLLDRKEYWAKTRKPDARRSVA